ncbi:oligosaccharide flippase family protein [Paenibacillus lupini]|uniref:oligosaccharide flippase family protein n=1 Tax=Paenibacillus lupini TaxID=1450204 RepID=UPI001423CC2A|nr:oligosaccharide flippase family protein [Paenibacillus lupini]NIK26283.1 O-antigen/teichoic acid export membrane protein [Paenibacillus lupini]
MLNVLRRKDSFGYIAQMFASNLFILFLNTLTGIIIARYLGPIGRGEQAAMIMWPQLLSYMVTLGLPSSIIYYMKQKGSQQGSLYIASLWMCLLLGMISILGGLLFLPGWMDGYSHNKIAFSCWALILIPFGLIGVINNAVLQARDEYLLFNRIRYLPNIITLVLLGALVVTGNVNPFYTSIAYLAPIIPISVWTMMRLLSIYKFKHSDLIQSSRQLVQYGIRSYGTDLAGTLSFYIDQVLVVGLLSPASLGIYLVALSLAKMLDIIQSSIVSVLFPQASGLQPNEAIQLTLKMYRISAVLTFGLVILLVTFAPYVMLLLYGASYKEAIPIFRVLIVQAAIASATWTLAQGFMATNRPGRVTMLKVLSLLMNAALINVLTPHMGIIGAAYSLLISAVVNFLLIIWLYYFEMRISWSSILFQADDWSWVKRQLLGKKNLTETERVIP